MGFELDLRKVHLGQSGIASFATKPQALAFAKARGWLSRDVTRAYNRFCMFWVVYQGFGDTLRFLGKTGAVVELPCSALQSATTTIKDTKAWLVGEDVDGISEPQLVFGAVVAIADLVACIHVNHKREFDRVLTGGAA